MQLLVVLRDGLQRPLPSDGEPYMWMTDEQQQAVVEFVERGGGFLNLHNSMGLYPADGAYLKLVGGAYTGHGPLERFRVQVVDREHAVTRGVSPFTVADEQHAPTYDEKKVHLLLESRSDEGKVAAAGWVYEPGRGRLCHLASGHTRESLLHPNYQRLLRNALSGVCGASLEHLSMRYRLSRVRSWSSTTSENSSRSLPCASESSFRPFFVMR